MLGYPPPPRWARSQTPDPPRHRKEADCGAHDWGWGGGWNMGTWNAAGPLGGGGRQWPQEGGGGVGGPLLPGGKGVMEQGTMTKIPQPPAKATLQPPGRPRTPTNFLAATPTPSAPDAAHARALARPHVRPRRPPPQMPRRIRPGPAQRPGARDTRAGHTFAEQHAGLGVHDVEGDGQGVGGLVGGDGDLHHLIPVGVRLLAPVRHPAVRP